MPRPERFLTGEVFGRLTALDRTVPNKARYQCECGTVKEMYIGHVLQGRSRSCGCLHREVIAAAATKRNTTHGMYGTSVYTTWKSMIDRCCNPNHHAYSHYGGRGISVCEQWAEFESFYRGMGARPAGRSLDRINNDHGYSPDNCRWATQVIQNRNRRDNVRMTLNGTTKTAAEWAEQLSIKRSLLYDRHRAGWTDERTLTTPSRKKQK